MTAVVGARNFAIADAGVVFALLQARYYDGSKGEFLSEDPVFLAVGNPDQVKQLSQQDQQQVLRDPQLLNSYGYASDNPITRSDPSGKFLPLLMALGFSAEGAAVVTAALEYYGYATAGVDAYNTVNTFRYPNGFSPAEKQQIYGQDVWDALPFSATKKFATPLQRSSLGVLGASLDTINFASGGTVLSGPPAKIPWQSLVPVGQIGTVNTNTGTQGSTGRTSSSGGQSQNTNSGFSAFVGLFNPFVPRITSPSAPPNYSKSSSNN